MKEAAAVESVELSPLSRPGVKDSKQKRRVSLQIMGVSFPPHPATARLRLDLQ